MKIKTFSVEKKDVEKLTGDELDLLKKFSRSKEYELLNRIADESKTRRAFEGLNAKELSELSMLSGVNIGVDFILDACERAKEELKGRGDVDTEE